MLEDYTQVPSNPHLATPCLWLSTWPWSGPAALNKIEGSKPIPLFGTYIALDAESNAISLALTTLPLLIGQCCRLSTILWPGSIQFVSILLFFTVSSPTPRAQATPNTHILYWWLVCVRISYQTMSLILMIEYLLHQNGQRVLIIVVYMLSGPLVSSPKMPKESSLLRNSWRRMMTLPFGSNPHPLILELSCLPYGEVWRNFLRGKLG